MSYISDIVIEMDRWFVLLNAKFFENSLETPVITIQKSRASNLGHFTLNPIWRSKQDDDCNYEINLSAHALHREIDEVVGVLLHEMIHYYNKVNDIKDASNNIHNKKFKLAAEKVGFIVEKSKSYGWGHTKNTEELKNYIMEEIKPNDNIFKYARLVNPISEPKPRKKNSFKYTCPTCGLVAKAKEDANLTCNECDCKLERED